MNNKQYTLGALRSPLVGHQIAEAILPKAIALPSTLDMTDYLEPVRDQGSLPTCVAQACACMKEWQGRMDSNLTQYMSPQFIYNNRNNQGSDGMNGQDAMNILCNLGDCLETTYPYGTIVPNTQIPAAAFKEAALHKCKNPALITTLNGLQTALYTNGPCLICFPVYNYSATFWEKQTPDQQEIGGHGVAVVGWTTTGFIIRNSWGVNWPTEGAGGYTNFPFTQWGVQTECWTAADVNPFIQNPIVDSCCTTGTCGTTACTIV